MPTNYGVSPTWLHTPPADIMGATITGLQLGEQAGQAAARAAEAQQRAREAAMEFQQRAQEGQQRRQMQEQQLAMESIQAAAQARESAFKFQQSQLLSRGLQELGPNASEEDMARLYAMHPSGHSGGPGSVGSAFRAMSPQTVREPQSQLIGLRHQARMEEIAAVESAKNKMAAAAAAKHVDPIKLADANRRASLIVNLTKDPTSENYVPPNAALMRIHALYDGLEEGQTDAQPEGKRRIYNTATGDFE